MPGEEKKDGLESVSNLSGGFGGITSIEEVLSQDLSPITIEDELETEIKEETKKKFKVVDEEKNNQDLITIEDEQEETEVESSEEEEIEEKIEEKIEEIPSEQSIDSPPSSVDANKYKLFAQELVSEGLFDEFTDKEWNDFLEEGGDEVKALIELFNRKVKNIEKSYEDSLTPEDREIYEGKKLGVPIDQIGNLNRFIQTLDNITDESLEADEATQKELIKLYYQRNSKLDESKISKIIRGLEDAGELFEESKTVKEDLKSLIKDEKKDILDLEKQKQKNAEESKQKQLLDLKTTIDNINEIIPGQKVSAATKKSLYDVMTKPVAKDENGNPINKANFIRNKNPLKFDILFNYYLQMGLFNTDNKGNFNPDTEKLTRNIKTKVSQSEFKKIMEKDKPSVGTFVDKSKTQQRSKSIFGEEFNPKVF